jgi:hypothetical protein
LPPSRIAEARPPTADLSPWQRSQLRWTEAGVSWEQDPATAPPSQIPPPAPASGPHQHALSPRRHAPGPRQRARGRHVKPESLPPDRTLEELWPERAPLPLAAPVFPSAPDRPDTWTDQAQDTWTDQAQDTWTDQAQDTWTDQAQDTWTDQDTWTSPEPWTSPATDQETWTDPVSWVEPDDHWDDSELPIRRRPSLPPPPDRDWPPPDRDWPALDDTSLLAPSARRPRTRRGLISRRTATIGVPTLVLAAVAILALALLTGHSPKFGPLTANQGRGTGQNSSTPQLPLTAVDLATYPGQQSRGVFQTLNRVVASGSTIVAMGSATTGSVVRQQFVVSSNGGASWHLAPVRGPGSSSPGHPAGLLAGGPGGWLAVGAQAIWTSPNGLSWTLAATHGISPQLPGDSVWVITSTARGFLAAGNGADGQAVIWTSANGVSWQRMSAARAGLPAADETVRDIAYATWRGNDTVISGQVTSGGRSYSAAWLSTNGGTAWTRVTIPVDHGASSSISGLAFDGSGLLAVRPGHSETGADDAVAYFSPNGHSWQYASTINPSGGFAPGVVKGSATGFVVVGQTSGQLLAYTDTGNGATWVPTGPLGQASAESVGGATVAPGDTVIAIGSGTAGRTGQQPMLVEANTTGSVRSVSLASIPGGVIPDVTVDSTAVADGEQIAVGSADGYPAVWRKASGGSWALVSSLSLVQPLTGDRRITLTSVTHGSAGWLAVGAPGPVILTSADGTTWRSATGGITAGLAGVAAVSAASGPVGYVIVGKLVAPGGSCVADVWSSPNLTSWTRAHDVNDATGSSQVLAVAASAGGFVSVGSHDSKPAIWTTTNGSSWQTLVLQVPAGAATAVLEQIAINGTRVAALGQATTKGGVSTPFAELSIDGGTAWQQVPFSSPGPDTTFTALTADSAGFTAAGLFGETGSQNVAVWTSATGATWKPSQASGLGGDGAWQITALAPSGSVAIGIGSIATQQNQQTVTLTLPAR